MQSKIILRGIICQVQKECDSLHASTLLKISCEKPTRLHIDTHSSKNNREILLVTIVDVLGRLIDQASLTTYLRSDFVVG